MTEIREQSEKRVGVYICHCGHNIAGTVDVEHVAEWAYNLPHVVISRDNRFMCASTGQEQVEEDIKEYELTHVVVASCSPHMHEKTFRGACARAGLNPYLFEMANIREHASWVHPNDKDGATNKAKALVSAAVYRVLQHEPLTPMEVEIRPETLIVGGGIAGIQAALEIASAGYHVYMVEREPSIGGHMAQLDKTFPTLDCSACILTPKMFDVGSHPNITMMTYAEVESVDGYVGNFTVKVRKKSKHVREDQCTGCGTCWEKCPVKVIDTEYEASLGYRKAIYRPFPQAVPKYPVIDIENCTYYKTGKCKACEKFCQRNAIDFDMPDEVVEIQVGNILLATGYELFDCRRIPQYGYGRLENVYTSMEFERLVNATGPTEGKITLRDGETMPKSVAIIHCVGSRDKNHNEYCSAICCMSSLKFAHLVMEKTGAEVYQFYIDMRPIAKGYEEFYHRILEEGANFIRGRVSEITDAAHVPEEEGKLIVIAEDTLIGRQRRVPVDMVILSAALEPRHDAAEVAHLFSVGCGNTGFFTERHPKLDPVATMTEGVYIAGACQGPKDIPDTVAQGAAAAARILSVISQRRVELEPVRASIDESRCSGCRICNNMCPYGAIAYLEDLAVSRVNPALCKGCGTCVAACPSQIITGAHFTFDQLMAEIDGIMVDVHTAAPVRVGNQPIKVGEA
ncbi:MAG TPA: CoB--CoM heterodisulfide reductase iron-sulfur subunit A family protein [Aggregatilineaceae bacterium]|nr:CoB--CoM heterodisulfide reductase iron-sulfur subunit A family protein [Aggregatilineaceae bacterium]